MQTICKGFWLSKDNTFLLGSIDFWWIIALQEIKRVIVFASSFWAENTPLWCYWEIYLVKIDSVIAEYKTHKKYIHGELEVVSVQKNFKMMSKQGQLLTFLR